MYNGVVMATGDDYDAWLKNFTTQIIAVNGIDTAVYVAPLSDTLKPTILIIHGLNGEYHGIVPLGYELRHDFRVIFVDVPAHGASAIPTGRNLLGDIYEWGRELLVVLRSHNFAIAAVVGHSFGSLAAQMVDVPNMVLLNPPFGLKGIPHFPASALVYFTPLIARLHGAYHVKIRRARRMMHTLTQEADAAITWSSGHIHTSSRQLTFQARLGAAMTASKTLLDIGRLNAVPNLLLLFSDYDTTIDNDAAPLDRLPNAAVVNLPTGHVSVFEMPSEIAEEIRRIMH